MLIVMMKIIAERVMIAKNVIILTKGSLLTKVLSFIKVKIM
tara:strand:+ start:86 stop:208 length:123 start_codon:yes stop_codon:yes gene_type:complete